MQHVLLIILENEAGALSRVIGLFSQRGYNIEKLTVIPTHTKLLSNITIYTSGNLNIIQQIKKQLKKLINVIKVTQIKYSDYIKQEILLIKILIKNEIIKKKITKILNKYNGEIIHIRNNIYIIKFSDTISKIQKIFYKIKKKIKILKYINSAIFEI
ncbi:acetolactate synthase small subunit [Buchnera aphidicola]|uniref:acetolactate synthase small subunit n=1 Tax=Buchnera aphidicola TaxID=9 RepID=UPI0031B6DDC0